jgi:hypothetical protein
MNTQNRGYREGCVKGHVQAIDQQYRPWLHTSLALSTTQVSCLATHISLPLSTTEGSCLATHLYPQLKHLACLYACQGSNMVKLWMGDVTTLQYIMTVLLRCMGVTFWPSANQCCLLLCKSDN